ncbi:hypothetical protein EV426DRAFT_537678 [Tirmania nivea]|nr:hypothetical protein EV426DRAFT_537678 [Tirmania nivea]
MDAFSCKTPSRAPARFLASSNWRVKGPPRKPSPSPTGRSKAASQQLPSPTRRPKDNSQPYHPSTERTQPHPKSPDYLVRPQDPSYLSSTRLYVGNLLYRVQAHTLTHFFSSAGFVNINISISIDPFTGRNPSFCFVDFESEEEAERALTELNGKEIEGRPVKIGKGVPKRRRDGDENQPPPIFDRWARTSHAPSHWFGQASLGKRLYVGGLPRIDNFTALEAEITKLFSGFKLEAISRLISPDPMRRNLPGNHYFVFVDMESSEEADRAVERLLGAPTWWGGKLKVHKARPGSDSRRVVREQSLLDLEEEGKEEGEKSWQGGEGKWNRKRSLGGVGPRIEGGGSWKGNWRRETEEIQNGALGGEVKNDIISGQKDQNGVPGGGD